MALTKEKRQALIKWLESMPWWYFLPYHMLKKEVERLTRIEENVHKFVQNPILIEQLMMSLGYTPEHEADLRALAKEELGEI